jgi:hypothetical protein
MSLKHDAVRWDNQLYFAFLGLKSLKEREKNLENKGFSVVHLHKHGSFQIYNQVLF